MRWRHTVALGIPVFGVLAVCGAGILSPVPAAGAQASVPTVTRAVIQLPKAVRPPGGKPRFDATFRGSQLNTKIWDTCYPKLANYNDGCNNWGNPQEAEWYQPSQVKVSDGRVRLLARREKTVGTTSTGARRVYECRSGMITSYPSYRFEYGFVQVVARIPHAKGLWPALWLAASSGKYPPEIDMLESWGVNQTAGSYLHGLGGYRARARYSPQLTVGWHTYSVSWTRYRIRYYVDRKLVLTVTKDIPRQRMYFIANLAEYKPATSGYCTGQLQIRSVKIWKN